MNDFVETVPVMTSIFIQPFLHGFHAGKPNWNLGKVQPVNTESNISVWKIPPWVGMTESIVMTGGSVGCRIKAKFCLPPFFIHLILSSLSRLRSGEGSFKIKSGNYHSDGICVREIRYSITHDWSLKKEKPVRCGDYETRKLLRSASIGNRLVKTRTGLNWDI